VSLPVETLRLTLATVAAAPLPLSACCLASSVMLICPPLMPLRVVLLSPVARIHRACAGAKTGAAMAYSDTDALSRVLGLFWMSLWVSVAVVSEFCLRLRLCRLKQSPLP